MGIFEALRGQPILVYDIETATNGLPDASRDVLKVFGCYSYLYDEYKIFVRKEDMRKFITKHKFFVGYNHISYDNVVLYNNGFDDVINLQNDGKSQSARFNKSYDVDLMRILHPKFQNRATLMKTNKGNLGDLLLSYSLDYVTRTLDLVDESDAKIQDFDYQILNKNSWTREEVKQIKEYLKRDVMITKKLYEWMESYFWSFREFLNDKDVYGKKYLTSPVAVYAYKAICNMLGWKEEYADSDGKRKSYGGGYVAYPAGEKFEGNIVEYDYSSLYPHVFMQCNLYSPKTGGWSGNGVFNVKGEYNNVAMGKIENLLSRIYRNRKELKKKKDPKEYSLKTILNSSYGISGNPAFKHLYNHTTASDCTSLARQWIMLARKKFREAGYKVIYTDTDSVYLIDHLNDKKKIDSVKDDIIKEIKDNVPFPQDTFDMDIDDVITHMWFFKGTTDTSKEDEFMDEDDVENKKKGFLKKNYIYIAKDFDDDGNWVDSHIVVKNLGVRKKSTSLLTRKIFWEYLVPKIKSEKKVKFPKTYFRNLIYRLLYDDLSLAASRYPVDHHERYKNSSQLQAQIAKRYGPGIHFLLSNKRIGVGKDKKYCTIEEFKKARLSISDLDLTKVWSELGYFIEKQKKVTLSQFGA